MTIPNTFSDGTPALASEVNQNFQTLASAVNASDCATAADVVCDPALSCPACPSCPTAPACDELGSYIQGQASGAGGDGSDVSYLIVLCESAGGTWDTGTSTCSVDVTDSAVAVAAAGSAACTQAGGTWDAGTSTCTAASTYNGYIAGFCAKAAISFPPSGEGVGDPYIAAYAGHTPSTEPALGAGCNVPGAGLDDWNEGYTTSVGSFNFVFTNNNALCAEGN